MLDTRAKRRGKGKLIEERKKEINGRQEERCRRIKQERDLKRWVEKRKSTQGRTGRG